VWPSCSPGARGLGEGGSKCVFIQASGAPASPGRRGSLGERGRARAVRRARLAPGVQVPRRGGRARRSVAWLAGSLGAPEESCSDVRVHGVGELADGPVEQLLLPWRSPGAREASAAGWVGPSRSPSPALSPGWSRTALYEALVGVLPPEGATAESIASAADSGEVRPWPKGSRQRSSWTRSQSCVRSISACSSRFSRRRSMHILARQPVRGQLRIRWQWLSAPAALRREELRQPRAGHGHRG
jgi:hypothetical protein